MTETESSAPRGAVLPPDPIAYDAVRNEHARARGLPGPYIAGGDEAMAAGGIDEFRARDVDREAIARWGFVIAREATGGRVVGYASLALAPGSTTVAWHDMTAVVSTWRGRGLATAMKRATIAAAIDHGLEALVSSNDEDNLPMQAINARLGYVAEPDLLTMRGPVARGIMAR